MNAPELVSLTGTATPPAKRPRTKRTLSGKSALLTIDAIGTEYGLAPSVVYKMIADKILPEVRLPGSKRRIWILRVDIEKLISISRAVRT